MPKKEITNMYLKPIIRICKSSLRSILGKIMSYDAPYQYVLHRDTQICASCPNAQWHDQVLAGIEEEKTKEVPNINTIRILHKEIENFENDCKNCSACRVEKKYKNEKATYQYYKKQYDMKRLPKTAVRLYLLLFSIPMDMMGNIHIIKDMPIHSLAQKLNVNKITIRRSIELLEASNLIAVAHSIDTNHYNFIVHSYDTMHLTGQQGGAGYLTITSDAMDTLLAIHNVNALRLELLKLLELDNISRSKDDVSNRLKINEVKKILPDHLNYQNKYISLHNNMPTIFNSYVDNQIIYYTLKTKHCIKMDLDELKEQFIPIIEECIIKNDIVAATQDILDITDIITQYPVDMVLHAISDINRSFIQQKKEPIRNLPGLVRTFTRNIYQNSLAA